MDNRKIAVRVPVMNESAAPVFVRTMQTAEAENP
jgi:hypothetical protein